MINIEGINYSEMRERLMCDEDTCKLIIRTFLAEVSEKLYNINKETENEKFITLAHGIKGSCANISAFECFECARTLEYKARAEGMNACFGELSRLNEMLLHLKKNIEDYFAGENEEPKPHSTDADDDIFFLKL